MGDDSSTYVSFATAGEFARYRREHRSVKNAVWVDWGYREAIHLKAFVRSANRDFEEALELLRREAKAAPYAAAPYIERGYILNVGLRKPREALESYRRALSLAREFASSSAHEPVALRGIGFALIELGELDGAESVFKESLALDPNSDLARSELQYIEQLRHREE
jgi:Flp pilus assembly protein TadD